MYAIVSSVDVSPLLIDLPLQMVAEFLFDPSFFLNKTLGNDVANATGQEKGNIDKVAI